MRIAKDCLVTLRQRVTDADGGVIDKGSEPIQYLHGGYADIFAAIEAVLEGKAVGERVEVALTPAESFGEFDATLVVVESADAFEKLPQVGDMFERAVDGRDQLFRVTEVADGKVVVDGNHPLAGIHLVFSAEILDIRPATADEIAAKGQVREDPPAIAPPPERPYHSQTHRLCYVGPTLLLPALGTGIYLAGWENAAMAVAAVWLAWTFCGRQSIGLAIRRWGERFGFFDFSPNLAPSPVERWIAGLGVGIPFLLAVVLLVAALFRAHSLSEAFSDLAVSALVFVILAIFGAVLVPFVIIVLTGFRIRPVIDGDI